jgi:hypothetical protein
MLFHLHSFNFNFKTIILLVTCIMAYDSLTLMDSDKSKSKAVPLHAMEALGGRGGIAPTHS